MKGAEKTISLVYFDKLVSPFERLTSLSASGQGSSVGDRETYLHCAYANYEDGNRNFQQFRFPQRENIFAQMIRHVKKNFRMNQFAVKWEAEQDKQTDRPKLLRYLMRKIAKPKSSKLTCIVATRECLPQLSVASKMPPCRYQPIHLRSIK